MSKWKHNLPIIVVFCISVVVEAQTTIYVNGACGDDAWTGLSPDCEAPDGPKATIQAGAGQTCAVCRAVPTHGGLSRGR